MRKKVQARRAATGGPKGDFYSIGNVVKDEYGALFMIERYQRGKWIVVALVESNSTRPTSIGGTSWAHSLSRSEPLGVTVILLPRYQP